jgi:hypothetical protein
MLFLLLEDSTVKQIYKSLLALCLGVQLVACSSPDPTECAPGGNCAFTGGAWEACCSSTQCEYRTSGTDFLCSGTDCAGAAAQLAIYCAGPAKSGSDTESELFKALAIEKANNVVLRKSIDELYNDLGKDVQQSSQ